MKNQNLNFNSKYQKVEEKTFVNYDTDGLNSYQNYLYRRALYGLKAIPEDELNKICSAKKKRINNVYLRAQRVLNVYKHKVTKMLTDSLLTNLFPNSVIAKSLSNIEEFDAEELNTLAFKDLGIEKSDIVELFIEEGILPKNFKELTPQDSPNFLPSLKK